uniref:Uncharacterized protein n=1 Tax=Anopheles maculatus TaxID=74869 RepID=A0A182SB95_9DIPT
MSHHRDDGDDGDDEDRFAPANCSPAAVEHYPPRSSRTVPAPHWIRIYLHRRHARFRPITTTTIQDVTVTFTSCRRSRYQSKHTQLTHHPLEPLHIHRHRCRVAIFGEYLPHRLIHLVLHQTVKLGLCTIRVVLIIVIVVGVVVVVVVVMMPFHYPMYITISPILTRRYRFKTLGDNRRFVR